MSTLNGTRVVIVTGASGALGTAVTSACVARGWRVAGIDHRSHPPPAPRDPSPSTPFVVGNVDLSSMDAARRAVAAIDAHFGRIDGLVNVAGTFRFETVEDADEASWESLFATNLKTAVNASVAALPHLRRSPAGRIVNIGAASALKGAAGMAGYTASKSAVHRFTESLAAELVGTSVTVNAVLPTTLDTPANRAAMPDNDGSRFVPPAQVAKVILFLLSPEASSVNGALIPVSKRA
jgi:3-oxoacyl-[acyl-carrier protein] reductase